MYYSRRQLVRDVLVSQPYTSLKELQERFPNVSTMTLRRDIEFCERHGDVVKVWGGARSMKYILHTEEENYNLRAEENKQKKQRIAQVAAEFISSGRSIYIDAGTTTMELVDYVPEARIIITTSGANVALALVKHDKIMVNLIGGYLNRESFAVSGPDSMEYADNLDIDVAFMSPSAVSIESGFTSGNYGESELKSKVVEKARKVIMLVISDKIGKTLPFSFCDIDGVDVIITDKPLPDEFTERIAEKNIQVIIAE